MRAKSSGKLVFDAERVSKSFDGVPVVRRLHAAHPARRSHRPHRPERVGEDDAAQAAGRRARARQREPLRGAPGCRSRTSISSASSSIPIGRSPTASTTATTRSSSTASRATSSATSRTSCSRASGPVSPVRSLSGGERNRLMLARLFARPANVLVMDEPTNDLDIETLELLEELVADFPGTVLLVSHDRTFLDNIVTSTLAFEGGGTGRRVRRRVARLSATVGRTPGTTTGRSAATAGRKPTGCGHRRQARGADRAAAARKLSFKEQREFETRCRRRSRRSRRSSSACDRSRSRGVLQGARGAHPARARATDQLANETRSADG